MPVLPQVKLLLVLLLVLSGSAQASALARSVLEASPVDDIVAQYPAMISEGVRQGLAQAGQVDPMVVTTVTMVVRNGFRAADLQADLEREIAASMSDEQLRAVGRWYETPLAGKISRAEINASRPEVWQTIQQAAPDLQARFRGTERANLFARFDRAARATGSAVDTTIAVQIGLANAVSAVQGSNGPGFDRLKQIIESRRAQTQSVVAQQVYGAYLHTYQGLNIDELKTYIRFLETGAGSTFTRVVTTSIQNSITGPVETVGSQLARFLGS